MTLLVPLQVIGIGIVVSYGIASLIKGLDVCVRRFSKADEQ